MAKNYFYNRNEEVIQSQLCDIKELISFFKKECGVYAYIAYGTLLGAVRENNVISHDTDYDIAYFSKKHTIKEIREELKNICKILIKKKMLVKLFSNKSSVLNPKESDLDNFHGQMHVKTPNGLALVDVFSSWSIDNNFYLAPNIQGQIKTNTVVPFSKITMKDVNFIVPKIPIKMLECLYGIDWTVPKDIKTKNKRKWMCNYE